MQGSITLGLFKATAISAVLMGSAASAQDALEIGAILPMTGPYASYGSGLSTAMDLAIQDVNAAGGVLGKPIALRVEDDQNDPTAGLNAARKLVDVNGSKAIVGTFASSITLPVLAYTVPAGIPVLTVSGAPAISDIGKDSSLAYRMLATEGFYAEGYAAFAAAQGYKKAYVLAANNAAQLDAAKSFEESFPKYGGTFLGTRTFEPGQASYQSEINDALNANPDIIMLASYTPDAITIAKMLYQLDPDVRIIGPLYSLGTSFVEGVGKQVAEGTLAVDAMSSEDSAQYQAVAQKYKIATGEEPTSNPYAMMSYDMITVLALAAEAAGSTKPADFVPYIRTVSNEPGEKVTTFAEGVAALKAGQDIDYDGVSSPVEFLETGDQARMFLRGFKLVNGDVTIVGPVTP